MSSLSADLIENIEILRSATADMSVQSIAGSINIILRRSAPNLQRSVKVSLSEYDGLPSGSLTGQYSDGSGTGSFSSTVNASLERNRWPSTAELSVQNSKGQAQLAQHTNSIEKGETFTVGFTSRLSWKPNDTQMFLLDALFQGSRFKYDGNETRTTFHGASAARPNDEMGIITDSTQARVTVNWKSPVGTAGKIDAKVMAAHSRRESDGQLRGFDENQELLLFRTVDSSLQDQSLTASGKYSLELGDNHTLGAGWDAQYGRRAENRIQRETSPVGYSALNLDEDYKAGVTRAAFFVQDEWTVTSDLSAYLGLRLEGLQSKTSGYVLAPVNNQFIGLSPTAQVLWKMPNTKADQMRLSLARTYKAPTARDLIPRRWVVNNNTATSPNFQGNPELTPELAWGLDIGYERYLSSNAFLGLSLYGRRIDNVILQRVYEDSGVWVSTPTNSGRANVFGLALEAKGKLKVIIDGAPDVDVRAGFTRNWSRIASVPGPGNRIKDQPEVTATLGADYRLPGGSYTIGGSFTFERIGFIQTSAKESTSRSDGRALDVYGLWSIEKTTNLRFTIFNMLEPTRVAKSTYAVGPITQHQKVASRSFRGVRVLFEKSF